MAVIIEKAETGAFVTNSSGMGKRNFAPRQRRAPRHGGRKPYAMSMMVKIALCALSCAAALLFRLHGQNDAPMQQAMAECSDSTLMKRAASSPRAHISESSSTTCVCGVIG